MKAQSSNERDATQADNLTARNVHAITQLERGLEEPKGFSARLAHRIADRRSHLDLQINLLSEQENTLMLRLLQGIAERVNAPVPDMDELTAMQERTQPEQLVNQILRAQDRKE